MEAWQLDGSAHGLLEIECFLTKAMLYGQVLESKLILARDLLDKERNFETYIAT